MLPRLFTTIFVVTLLSVARPAQPQTVSPPPDTPVGHWVAEHPSDGGIGSWWDFRSDGTLTHYIGAIVTTPITRSDDTFTSPAPTTYGSPITVKYHVEGETLHLSSSNAPDQTLTRVGPAPSATDPLLGKWKLNAPAKPSNNPTIAAQQKIMTNAILVFSPDNTESVRIGFDSSEGTWDATAHTFQMRNQNGTFSFERTGAKLILGLPPDNKKTDSYLPDPIL
jgi:hypothetical protein